MTVWYDVSDLMDWPLPHLTGIQRTTVGILDGLTDCDVAPHLARWDEARGHWESVAVGRLPKSVRDHLRMTAEPAQAVAGDRGDATPAAVQPKAKPRFKDRILGGGPAARELQKAIREFRTATRCLVRAVRAWSRSRGLGQDEIAESRVEPQVDLCFPDASRLPFRPGDVLLSLGATWGLRRHADACGNLRRHGVVVIRMIYDLIPTLKPQWVFPAHHEAITRWARAILSDSDGVLTISEFSSNEIKRYCDGAGLPPPRTTVVRLGDVLESQGEAAPPLPRFVPRRPFFLCVSTLDVRKNHRLLYDAWSVLAARDPNGCPDLVCVGTPHLFVTDLLREISFDQAVNGRIHFLQAVTDPELAWYYRHCAATIYPSRYEGWGLPVAESLGHGRLCLASHATSIPEISADLPEFFDPYDVPGLVLLLERTMRDPAWVQHREAEIRRRFVPTPWSHTARQVLQAASRVSESVDQHRTRGAA